MAARRRLVRLSNSSLEPNLRGRVAASGTSANQGAAAGLTAAAATAAATTQARQQAPAQPGTSQSPARAGDTTGAYAPSSGQRAANNGAARTRATDNSSARTRAASSGANAAAKWGSGAVPAASAGSSAQGRSDANNPAVPAVAGIVATEDHHGAKPKVGVARRTRKARLRLSRFDPWSVMKTSFLFSIAAGIMLVASMYSIWAVLSTSQLFDSLNEIVRSVVSTPGDTTPFRIQEYINTQKVMGVTALIACVDVVIFTALATLGSFLYNLAATMLGGLEITLAED